MREAGVKPLPGHVGRLDAETSGLILVTEDTLLLRAILNWPRILAAYGGRVLEKRYSLLLLGKHEPSSPQLAMLGDPLIHHRGGKEYHSKAVEVIHHGCFQDVGLCTGDATLIDRTDDEQVERDRAKLATQRIPAISRATGEPVPLYVPADGWCTRVELVLSQGRHRQIRRLCVRANLKLLHLKRLSVGPISLDSAGAEEMRPGEVRELAREEKEALFEASLPRLLSGEVSREHYREIEWDEEDV